jgi:hypothetical protein
MADNLFQILRFIQCSNGDNDLYINDSNCGRKWQLRHIFDFLSDAYSKHYPPSEYLASDAVLFFNSMIVFRYYIPKKHM